MASVEDIYRKIRRGETAGLKFSRPSDKELVDGVERIRSRLSKNPIATENFSKVLKRNKLIWLVPAALAAIALVAVLYFPRTMPAPVFATGTTQTFGSIEIRVLTVSKIKHEFVGGTLTLNLTKGAIAVKRKTADTALSISTPDGTFEAKGTKFIIEHEKETSVELTEGRLEWRRDEQIRVVNERHPRVGRDLSALRALLPPSYMNFRIVRPNVRSGSANMLAGAFRPGACVIYTVNGNRRQGTIREVMHGEYRLAHEGIDEPDLFSAGDLISCGDTRKPPVARPVIGSPLRSGVEP